jgi:hypothetical protein
MEPSFDLQEQLATVPVIGERRMNSLFNSSCANVLQVSTDCLNNWIHDFHPPFGIGKLDKLDKLEAVLLETTG